MKADSKPKSKRRPSQLTPQMKAAQWKPGQSGNPQGRPRKPMTILSDALREKLKQVGPDGMRTYAEILADRLVDAGIQGKVPVQAIAEIADRTEGRARQPVEFNDVTNEFAGWTTDEKREYATSGKRPERAISGGSELLH